MYQIAGASLMMLFYMVFVYCKTYLDITNIQKIIQIYQSIVCSVICLLAIAVGVVHSSQSPFATSPLIQGTIQIMTAFFIVDMGLMIWQRNTDIYLWGRQVVCVLSYLLLVDYYEYPIKLLSIIGISKALFICNSIESVNINFYRIMILLWIRFPLWLYVGYVAFYPATPMSVRLFCSVGMFVMLHTDKQWFKKYHRVLTITN